MTGAGDSAAAVLLTSVLQRNSYVRLVMRALRFLTRRLQRWRPLGASVESSAATSPLPTGDDDQGEHSVTPVGYRRSGDEIEIAANMPGAKNWWPNFVGRAHC
jgi:hypothetical protein